MNRPAIPRASGRGPSVGGLIPVLVAAAALLLAGCASTGGGTSLPWCRVEHLGDSVKMDSTLAGVVVHWQAEGSESEKAALEETLRECAERGGYRVGVEGATSRWVVVRREGAAPPGAGEPPRSRDGYAAALADRVRRMSPRAVPPTRATVELQVQQFGVGVWTGEARFDPDASDEAAGAAAALRLVAWQLPRFAAPPPTFERLASDSTVAFYRARLQGRTFLRPVVPYPVRFPRLEREYMRGGSELEWGDTVNAHSHDDPSVLPACLDLVLHADAALPHTIPGYRDLTGAAIWGDVSLFGMYRDGTGMEVPVEVRLKGDTRGYDVRETRVLDARETDERRRAGDAFAAELARFFETKGR